MYAENQKTHFAYTPGNVDRHEILGQIGIDPIAQSKRASLLIDTLGSKGEQIAAWESDNNRENYFREFILDEPVSRGQKYYTYNEEYYSYPLHHDLLKISGGIHPGERNGRTLQGFKKYETIGNHPNTEAATWYSPAGVAGDKPPFDKLFFESGRLYLNIKLDNRESFHLDIKINEKLFPIKDLLDFLSDHFTPENNDVFDYLDNPIQFNNASELLQKLVDFPEYMEMRNDPLVYIARRNDPNSQAYYWNHIVNLVQKHLADGKTHRDLDFFTLLPNKPQEKLTDSYSIEKSYYDMMFKYMKENNLEKLTLYGCSTTSSVTNGNIDINAQAERSLNAKTTPPSAYGTAQRLNEPTYGFDNEGNCKNCHKKSDELGPCFICRDCDTQLRKKA